MPSARLRARSTRSPLSHQKRGRFCHALMHVRSTMTSRLICQSNNASKGSNTMQPWKTVSRQTILDRSPWLVVEQHAVELPDGRLIADWPWVITRDYVNVVAVTAEGTFLCFRQTKYAVSGTTLALVGGYLEPDEPPLTS